ncbi:hypothetical protein EIN_173300 [Entamoeba invadens IP1]|uniref:Upf1 domain-containing protein n=1 Tax=Entamoeba invadens IP1 TaxID=370355 RepID=A0A0A1TYM8_ENTIV|nr:hypothetical protein EIN_173300 [Entamoeba invadens IP1]ELP84665.1 hypothetical protein EIN_173300 [Entamoeba invadens IP1]|eukprot:XP_004184011.1 hypothetical protein EIN_173300 [Entamoeba invadens IP1]
MEEEQKCTYCDQTCGIKCEDCGKYFCNGRILNHSFSQILFHLKCQHHKNVSLKGEIIKCSKCGDSNIFNLKCNVLKEIFCHVCLRNDTVVPEIEKPAYEFSLVGETKLSQHYFGEDEEGSDVDKKEVRAIENVVYGDWDGTQIANYYKDTEEYQLTYDYLIEQEDEVDDKRNVIEDCYKSTETLFTNWQNTQPLKRLKMFKMCNVQGVDKWYVQLKLWEKKTFIKKNMVVVFTFGGPAGLVNETNFESFENHDDENELIRLTEKVDHFAISTVVRISQDSVEMYVKENLFKSKVLKEKTKMTEELAKSKLIRIYFICHSQQTTRIRFNEFVEQEEGTEKMSLILGNDNPGKKSEDDIYQSKDIYSKKTKLNETQKNAVLNAMNNPISVVIGPPGTGKTKCAAVATISYLEALKREDDNSGRAHSTRRALCVASSNSATEVFANYCSEEDLTVVRIIPYDSIGDMTKDVVDKSIYQRALDYAKELNGDVTVKPKPFKVSEVKLIQQVHPKPLKPTPIVKKVEIEKDSEMQEVAPSKPKPKAKTQTHKGVSKIDDKKDDIRHQIVPSVPQFKSDPHPKKHPKSTKEHQPPAIVQQLEFILERSNWGDYDNQRKIDSYRKSIDGFVETHLMEIIGDADCVCATSNMIMSRKLDGLKFDLSVLDEAGQVLEPQSFVTLCRGQKSILLGDLQQLTAVVKSEAGKKAKYDKSAMERFIRMGNVPVTNLNQQYRMDRGMHDFCSSMFYNGELQYAKRDVKQDEKTLEVLGNIFEQDEKKCFPLIFINHKGTESSSEQNMSLFNEEEHMIVLGLLEKMTKEIHVSEENIAVITPYFRQKSLIQQRQVTKVRIETIDGFQGNEKDFVFVSTVRCNKKGGPGFMGNYHRVNVSLTRARKVCVVVGNKKTLKRAEVWRRFFNYIAKNDSYYVWENKRLRHKSIKVNDKDEYTKFSGRKA